MDSCPVNKADIQLWVRSRPRGCWPTPFFSLLGSFESWGGGARTKEYRLKKLSNYLRSNSTWKHRRSLELRVRRREFPFDMIWICLHFTPEQFDKAFDPVKTSAEALAMNRLHHHGMARTFPNAHFVSIVFKTLSGGTRFSSSAALHCSTCGCRENPPVVAVEVPDCTAAAHLFQKGRSETKVTTLLLFFFFF